jgi:hypothetical protein
MQTTHPVRIVKLPQIDLSSKSISLSLSLLMVRKDMGLKTDNFFKTVVYKNFSSEYDLI